MDQVKDFFKHNGGIVGDSENILKAFKRMSLDRNWRPATLQRKKQELANIVATKLESNLNSLKFLQDLCERYFAGEPPQSITQCKKLLNTIYVNIWDVVKGSDRTFDNYKSFCVYCRKNPFPREEAKSKNLNVFLRKI
jgi:hypothetical protein